MKSCTFDSGGVVLVHYSCIFHSNVWLCRFVLYKLHILGGCGTYPPHTHTLSKSCPIANVLSTEVLQSMRSLFIIDVVTEKMHINRRISTQRETRYMEG